MQSHSKLTVADDESLGTDEKRDLATGEVADMRDERAAHDRYARTGLRRRDRKLQRVGHAWYQRKDTRERDADRCVRQESPTSQILHLPSSETG